MFYCVFLLYFSFFFFNDTATTEIYTLSLHDALPISAVLILTAWGSDALEQQARQLGVVDFLSKGLSLDVLVDAMERTLQQTAQAASPAQAAAPGGAPRAAPVAAGDEIGRAHV